MTWTLARAKDQLSQVIRKAVHDGPQTISVRGQVTAFVVSKSDYEHLRDPGAPGSLKTLLGQMNLEGLDLERDQTRARQAQARPWLHGVVWLRRGIGLVSERHHTW